ncbi:MAG: Tfx family DNA-binding protein [Halobacteria archaeon]|nr:Tfx family DNA-binding protein [Halobacteria archaeon]
MDADSTVLTQRQIEVLRLREEGLTQEEVAEELGTTAANVSAVESAARDNIEKARRTLEVARLLRSPASVTAEEGADIRDLVDEVYEKGDETGVKIEYCEPELYSHLYEHLRTEGVVDGRSLVSDVEVGITREGEVKVHV